MQVLGRDLPLIHVRENNGGAVAGKPQYQKEQAGAVKSTSLGNQVGDIESGAVKIEKDRENDEQFHKNRSPLPGQRARASAIRSA